MAAKIKIQARFIGIHGRALLFPASAHPRTTIKQARTPPPFNPHHLTPLEPVHTMHEVVAASSARTGFYIMLLIPFAVIALLLAAVGLYGLIAYSVQQRTQEIGVRMALGAGPEDVRFMVVLQGMRLAFLGIVIGIPAALALTRVMVHLIFGIPTWDPLVLAAVAFLLSAVALFATCFPAIRATRIDPMDALRC